MTCLSCKQVLLINYLLARAFRRDGKIRRSNPALIAAPWGEFKHQQYWFGSSFVYLAAYCKTPVGALNQFKRTALKVTPEGRMWPKTKPNCGYRLRKAKRGLTNAGKGRNGLLCRWMIRHCTDLRWWTIPARPRNHWLIAREQVG